MAEVARNTYATTAGNAAAGTPNQVAVVNDGTADRQIMVIGDPTTPANLATVGTTGALNIQGYQPAVTAFAPVSATGAQGSASALGYNIVTLTLRTFTGTTPSITWKLEASDDNTNWVQLQGINNSTGLVGNLWTQAAALTAGTAGPSVDYTIGAYTNVRINVTAISGASATAAFGLAFQTMPYEASPGAVAQGTAANGAAVVGNPVLVGGSNGTNTYYLKTDTSGQLQDNVAQINGVAPLMGNGTTGTGSPRVTIASDNTANTNPWLVRHAASTTSSGLLIAKILAAATNNSTLVLTGTRTVYGWHLVNNATTTRYVRFFNKATAPTSGTDSPLFVIPLPGSGGAVMQPGIMNIAFSLGFGYTITAAAADLDNTSVTANDVVGTIWYN